MRTSTIPHLLLLLLFATAAHAAPQAQRYQVQNPGVQHADEILAVDGEDWLALVEDPAGARLVSTRIEVRPVPGLFDLHDEALVIPPEALGGRDILTPDLSPLMLLRGPQLHPGEVALARLQQPGDTLRSAGSVLELGLPGDAPVRLELVCQPLGTDFDSPEPDGRQLCLLVLEQSGATQILGEWLAWADPSVEPGQPVMLEAGPVLLFAGDLDGDGRLDLLLDLGDHYNLSAPTLMLSGEARGRQLLAPVAHYLQTGC